MGQRNTTTGKVLEEMVIPALQKGGYHYRKGVYIGHRPGGRKYKIDIAAWNGKRSLILISLKWQQVGGTAEEKIPFEVISLEEVIQHWPEKQQIKISCANCKESWELDRRKPIAYLVLGGQGWTLKDFYIRGGLNKYFRTAHRVKIIPLERFVALANQRQL